MLPFRVRGDVSAIEFAMWAAMLACTLTLIYAERLTMSQAHILLFAVAALSAAFASRPRARQQAKVDSM